MRPAPSTAAHRAAAAPHTHRVAVLAYDGMAPFELGVVVEVFGLARPELDERTRGWYSLDVCAEVPAAPLAAVGGFVLQASHGLDVLARADTVIVPGQPVDRPVSPPLVDALRDAHARGARIVSICSGAFALAAAGLLDDRAAATHWRYAATLQERHPRVRVDPEVLYVDDGDVLTSAGSAAGIDLCLHLVRRDHGAEIANHVARRLVVAPHREGGQAQFIEQPMAAGRGAGEDAIARTMDWALERIAQPLPLEQLAAQAHLSPRSFTRHFRRATGTSPTRWLLDQRVRASLALLEGSDLAVEHVGDQVGIPSPAAFRRHFARAMGVSPAGYRRAFRAREAA
ncbi:MAG: AraC family transcriptional regulator [Solirubrobacterales bacterium]|nr:AraC family transcriptional regulator [Solirubrobacterales bacterium]